MIDRDDPIFLMRTLYGDGVGYVALLDVMGDQFTPAEDARTSTGKGRLGPEKDAKLQERLVRDGHTSPFEGVIVKIEAQVPLCVIRELERHRTLDKTSDGEVGIDITTPEENMRKWFARNEMSGRYVQLPDQYYHPSTVRGQSTTDKQGGWDVILADGKNVGEEFVRRGWDICRDARELYNWAIEHGIERGLARIYNTQNQYTRIRLTGSLKNWLDFLYLRLPRGVLWECRRVAEEIEDILHRLFPQPVEMWRENVREGVRLTRTEARALRSFLESGGTDVDADVLAGVARKLAGPT